MPLTKNLQTLFLVLIATGLILTVSGQVAPKLRWIVLKDGAVKVDGSTNINKFSCSITGYTKADTLICYKNARKDVAAILSGRLSLPITGFDCMNAMMTNDLRKTLKSKDFPTLNISFLTLNKYPEFKPVIEVITGMVTIELAGTSKNFEVNYRMQTDEQRIIHLIGTQSIRFSDFNLTPPRKLGGMIRADDKLEVTFRINFKMMPG